MRDPQKSPWFRRAVQTFEKTHDPRNSNAVVMDPQKAQEDFEEQKNDFILGLSDSMKKKGLSGHQILQEGAMVSRDVDAMHGKAPIKEPQSTIRRPMPSASGKAVAVTKDTLSPVYETSDGGHAVDVGQQPVVIGSEKGTGDPDYMMPDGSVVKMPQGRTIEQGAVADE
jgi:hypothetical protein